VKVAVIKRRSGAFPQVKSLKVDLRDLSTMGVAQDPDTPLTRENAVVCAANSYLHGTCIPLIPGSDPTGSVAPASGNLSRFVSLFRLVGPSAATEDPTFPTVTQIQRGQVGVTRGVAWSLTSLAFTTLGKLAGLEI
jgi:hypothetical protein